MDADLITPELRARLDDGQYEPPSSSRDKSQSAGRVICPYEQMHRGGLITDWCKDAADKLKRHYWGARKGISVTSGYGERLAATTDNSDDGNEGSFCAIEQRAYHRQQIDIALWEINDPEMARGMIDILINHEGEGGRNVRTVGRDWLGCKSDQQAYIAGVAYIRPGLERLARHWHMDPP